MLLSTVGESGESTPEDWQTSYQKYLEDFPISQGIPTSGRGSSSKQPETKSPKKKDKVDQHLQAMQRKAEHMVAIRRKADDFFRRNRSLLEKPPLQSSGDQKPAAEGIIQWVRLMNFDSVLLQPDYLFHILGATTPSIEATTMAELVMGQYELAKERSEEIWLREARQWATMFFPTNWIDSHLTSFIEGKRLRLRRSRASAAETSTSTLVKDRRVVVEGQDLP